MTANALTSLLLNLSAEFVRLHEFIDSPESQIVEMSMFRSDNSNFRADAERAVEVYIHEGKCPMDLKARELLNLRMRFFFAAAFLSEYLLIREARKIRSTMLWCAAVRAALQLPESDPRPIADFDESTLAGDRENVLRTLLVDNWGKVGDDDLAKVVNVYIEGMRRFAGD